MGVPISRKKSSSPGGITDDIAAVYESVAARFPEMLHPNLSQVTLRPWGAKEFALLNGQIGVIIQQW